MVPAFRIEALGAEHDRAAFTCGSDPLDGYFRSQATQDIRRRVAACFVAVEVLTSAVAAYYTIAASSVPLKALPAEAAKRLPRYPLVPAVRIGRLAIATAHQGKGLGGAMLTDALIRALASDVVAFAAVVDAKDEAAADFYRHHGFLAFADTPLTLFLPLAEFAKRQAQ